MLRENSFTGSSGRRSRGDRLGKSYDIFIMLVAIASIVPLMFKESNAFLDRLDIITVYILFSIIFFVGYRTIISAAESLQAFILYPLPHSRSSTSYPCCRRSALLGRGWRILRMLRIFKAFHYSDSFTYIINAFEKEKRTLGPVLIIALAYIFVSALAMFSYEPETFDSFFRRSLLGNYRTHDSRLW